MLRLFSCDIRQEGYLVMKSPLSIALNIVTGGLLVKGYVSRIVILEANLIRSLDSLDFRSILGNDRSP